MGDQFTAYGWLVCTWTLGVSFQYGYHVAALNQIQAVLTCKDISSLESPSPVPSTDGLPTCIPMTDFAFSMVTSIFTVGGLAGSLTASIFMDRWGRRGASRVSALAAGAGAFCMGIAPTVPYLLFGRFLVGIGAGIGICVCPIYLSEIAPNKIKNSVGVLTQLSIVIGILFSSSVGLYLATPTSWRMVLFIPTFMAVIQLALSGFIVESPVFLRDREDEAAAVKLRLWGSNAATYEPILADVEHTADEPVTSITVLQALKAPDLRRALLIVSSAMISQQVSGINAVLYYSNDILGKALPDMSPYVSLGITIVNVIMTFPPIFLIERVGKKSLLRASTAGALISLVAVGLGLDTSMVALSGVAILTFVMSFAVGLGPIPFVMIPEVSPYYAVSALSSIALSLNWISNFAVALVFLPLRNYLSSGNPESEGRVFFVFAIALLVSTSALSRVYR